ncbi:hypothetical protein NDI37_27105 [Funiculus sociatus GB2-A5]|uniref:Uncharacterized protein n=1 Tax=Funiculus sociatus GB2-A5 TaxID=2933946 RepID=A0ABV0JXC0_9CYAN|nr:hypothetical protein [Trichocoleus sp. FACHB-6]MBD2062569.1 hypothetical protein [Trichocoleus sp. FACHB-6]
MLDSFFEQSYSLASLLSHNPDKLSHNPDKLTGDSLELLLHNPDQVAVDSGERRSPHATTERSPLPEFIRKHELTDALKYLEAKGLCGEHALFALALTQNLMCRGVEL